VSVLVQLAARRTGRHPVAPAVFRPRPKVDSALVAFARIHLPERIDDVRTVVEGAFSHRRKTLPNALELAHVASRSAAAAALETIGRSAETRAEALTPDEFVALADALSTR
jgi:16S rRNA (adenine1518-N6/adenine1519-N6)-dimethyltransferase